MASIDETTRYICLFHSQDRARAAVNALEATGSGHGAISTLGGSSDSGKRVDTQTLSELGVPDRDLKHLQDGLKDGGVLVSLEAPESRSAEIEKIFHKYSADQIDEVEPQVVTPHATASAEPVRAVSGEAVLPVVQEELQVGKRQVDRGGVRVYRHTVAEPVSQDVDLHAERVVLEYREVNRPATDADVRAGSQQIELIEIAEVPVVEKVARVVEEVRIGKTDIDRTEVIQDTVRHTEVEVQPLEDGKSNLRD